MCPEPVTLWTVETFYGLFEPRRILTLEASSLYGAECAADELLTDGEWFPSFTATRIEGPLTQPRNVPAGPPSGFQFALISPADGQHVGGGWVIAPSAVAAKRFAENTLAGTNTVEILAPSP
ncbi:hypothetical protein [Microbacterium capsulatum]|uniref:Uncharacterized protein n=1 Tax=Microbacterium capsulatum TaxID=3041921 RepID=A0ABU0XHZ6_9MICO|nr:hypothetical protein [Microbacterium sp. ASV81]MDQ4214757.1 hypothetical protein [Microbacterium sp. ASV81]